MISARHKQQFESMKQSLTSIGAKESGFIRVELLFFEAISVAREYGDDVANNELLGALRQLQANEYKQTQGMFKKNTQRERVIGRFIRSFRDVLTVAVNKTVKTQSAS